MTAATPTSPSTRRLVLIGYAVLAAFTLWFWTNSRWESTLLNVAEIGMLLLGTVPILRWLARGDVAYPLAEVILLTTVPFYALPLITDHEKIRDYPVSTVLEAALIVLAFQVCCLAGSALASRTFRRRLRAAWWSGEIVAEKSLHVTAYTNILATLWLVISSISENIPHELSGTLRAVFLGVGIISTFIQARLWGSGRLSLNEKILLCVNVGAQFILSLLSLMLISGLTGLLVVLVGYFTTARRVPWVLCLVLLPVIGILQNGKTKMRDVYWGEEAQHVALTDLPVFLSTWIEYGLQSSPDLTPSTKSTAVTYGLMRRASLFHIVCTVAYLIPEHDDFLQGETYVLIPPQIVPRLLWPGKPSPNDSVKILSTRLGILTPLEAETTSIAYGLVAEAYANFGFTAVAILGFVLGFCFRRLALAAAGCATLSSVGLLLILCFVWCLNVETTLAVWLSSLYQAGVAVFAPLLIWKRIQ